MSRIPNTGYLGEDVVHGLWGAGIVPAEDAEEAEHLDLQEGVRDTRDVVLRRVAGHDQILGIIHTGINITASSLLFYSVAEP